MRIIADENIPLVKEIFGTLGTIQTVKGRSMTNSVIKECDALLVRAVTKIDSQFVLDSPVKFIGTATAGFDHIDVQSLEKNGIDFSYAAGSNSNSVAEYIFAVIFKHAVENRISLTGRSIGVIGIGAIGSKVSDRAEKLGMKVFRNDPPLKNQGVKNDWYDLEELYSCDIITIHTPLNLDGLYKTLGLFDKKNLQKLKGNVLFINAARGQVVNNRDLLESVDKGKIKDVILDVWENEPDISSELLDRVWISTPHIAGYSYDGKIAGTEMIYQAFCRHFNLKTDVNINLLKPSVKDNIITVQNEGDTGHEKSIHDAIKKVYDVESDSNRLKKSLDMPEPERPCYFDDLRKNYPIRREFTNYMTVLKNQDEGLLKKFRVLGFQSGYSLHR